MQIIFDILCCWSSSIFSGPQSSGVKLGLDIFIAPANLRFKDQSEFRGGIVKMSMREFQFTTRDSQIFNFCVTRQFSLHQLNSVCYLNIC